jgi:hypothetical protein
MIILHGQNTVLSRQKLSDLAVNFSGEIIRLNGEKCSLTDLTQALESPGLLDNHRQVVIENLFSRRPGQIKDRLINYLKKIQPSNLVIWEPKKIDGRRLTAFKNAQIQHFELKPLIFKFLDTFYPGNSQDCLNHYHQALKQNPPDMIFYMLVRQLRLLLTAKTGTQKNLKLAPWQQAKIMKQADRFELIDLIILYRRLLKIDWQQKTGRSPFSLQAELDLLVIGL